MHTVLVTGANGFVGRALCGTLTQRGIQVHATVRKRSPEREIPQVDLYEVGDLNEQTDWEAALKGVDTVFHLAATVHRPDITDPLVYQRSICDGTKRLTEQALQAGVKRFIFISSIAVYGLEAANFDIVESTPCHPTTPYGIAKLAAEHALKKNCENNMEWVIIRPPLVYGPGGKGNFQRLFELVQKFPVLPFGCATQHRSMVAIDNLVDFMLTCATHHAAAQQIFNINDDAALSTLELCQIISKDLHKTCIQLPIPLTLLKFFSQLIGKNDLYNKLFSRLCHDITHAKKTLGWKPVTTAAKQFNQKNN